MTGSLLSWDDFEEDIPVKTAVNQDAALRAAESIKNIDTTEAEAELVSQGEAIAHTKALKEAGLAFNGSGTQPLLNPSAKYTPEQLKGVNQTMIERAKNIVKEMDAQLLHGGRVNVTEKFLLNCQADLNQLVPFKYPEPWSLYLTSCENHWMPAEIGIEKAAAELASIGKGTPRKMIARLYYNYQYRNCVFAPGILLSIYRHITNPECRQYLLRQAFESAAITHAMSDFNEIFNPTKLILGNSNLSSEQWQIDGWTFKNRHKLAVKLIPLVSDLTSSTKGLDNTSKFIEELIYLYGYINWTMQIVTIYQMINCNNIEDKMANLTELLKRLLKDMQSQTAFAKFFISTAIQENPKVFTDEFVSRVRSNMSSVFDAEFDLASTLANTDTEVKDVMDVVKYYINDFLTAIGIPALFKVQLTKNNEWFVVLVQSLQPHISRDAGLSGNGGSLEF